MSRRRQSHIMSMVEYEGLRIKGHTASKILSMRVGLSEDDFTIYDIDRRRSDMVTIDFDIINDNFCLEELENMIEPPPSMIKKRKEFSFNQGLDSPPSRDRNELYGASIITDYVKNLRNFNSTNFGCEKKPKSSIDILRDEVKEWLSDALT